MTRKITPLPVQAAGSRKKAAGGWRTPYENVDQFEEDALALNNAVEAARAALDAAQSACDQIETRLDATGFANESIRVTLNKDAIGYKTLAQYFKSQSGQVWSITSSIGGTLHEMGMHAYHDLESIDLKQNPGR